MAFLDGINFALNFRLVVRMQFRRHAGLIAIPALPYKALIGFIALLLRPILHSGELGQLEIGVEDLGIVILHFQKHVCVGHGFIDLRFGEHALPAKSLIRFIAVGVIEEPALFILIADALGKQEIIAILALLRQYVVRVAAHDERDFQPVAHLENAFVELPLRVGEVILNLQEEVFAEVLRQRLDNILNIIVFPEGDAGRCDDHVIPRQRKQQRNIDPWALIKPCQVRFGQNIVDALATVFVAGSDVDMPVGWVRLRSVLDPVGFRAENEFQIVLLGEVAALDIAALIAVFHGGDNAVPQFQSPLGVIRVGNRGIGNQHIGSVGMTMIILENVRYDSRLLPL